MLDQIANGRTDLVFDLLAGGQTALAVDANGTPIITWCAYYGDVSALRYLVSRGAALEALGDNFDLNGAAFHGHWRLVQYLIENGADVNHPLPDTGETPLHAATCHPGRPAFDLVVRVLLAAGADPNAKTRPGVETGCLMLDANTKGETPLHRAAAFASTEIIEALIEAGATIDAIDANDDSPLAWASWHARPDDILRKLCFDGHRIHPHRDSQADHGQGISAMERYLLGKPRL